MGPGTLPSAGGRARGAGAAAARALPDDRAVAEPCATCPTPRHADLDLDGALLAGGCTPVSDQRAMGRLRPRQVVVGYTPPDPVGGAPSRPIYGPDPTEPRRPRRALSRDEIDRAFATPTRPTGGCCARVLAQEPPPPPRTIVYVNGIQTTQQGHCCTQRAIANTTCANVVGIYNATESLVTDLAQSKGDINTGADAAAGRPVRVGDRRNPAVDSARDLLVVRGRAGEQTEIWAHSQGGAVTSAALYGARQELAREGVFTMDRVTVNSFGSAAPRWPDGPRYTHYIHTGDPVAAGPSFSPSGMGLGPYSEAMAGRGATVVVASGRSPAESRLPGTYAWRDVTFPPPRQPQLWPQVNNDFRFGTLAHHYMDSSYLPLYRQRERNNGGVACTPESLPAGDPCEGR